MKLSEKKAFEQLYDLLFCTSEHAMAQADVGYLITLACITGYLSHNLSPACIAQINDLISSALKMRTPFCSQYKRFLSYLQSMHMLVKREGTLTLLGIQPRVGFFASENG